jgi:acetylornithine deacetylase
MLNGHLDIVGVEGMAHAPFNGAERDGRLYGRGATDMKGGVAAMCAAAARVAARGALTGEVIVAAVADEEFESLGTRALLAAGVRAEAAVVTEPTRLAICPAHRGFAWIEVTVHGRAAHGSRYDLGVDAIRHAALLMAELDALEERDLARRTHPLLGRASLHASTISGGTGWSTYPESCTLRVERRTLPGERAGQALDEVERILTGLRDADPSVHAVALLGLAREAWEHDPSSPAGGRLTRELTAAGATTCASCCHARGEAVPGRDDHAWPSSVPSTTG